MSGWPIVRLGEVLNHRKEFILIDDLATYKRPRVRTHVQGIVLRDEVPGALIKTKKQQVCRMGEFLVAEIDAKVGGFGIVPEELDGAIVSSHYFLFNIDETKLDRSFLDYCIRTSTFREQVEAQGSTNYAAIRPADVLTYEIPIPTMETQLRVVARIEELAGHIREAQALRKQVAEEIDTLLIAMAHRGDLNEESKSRLGWQKTYLSQVIKLVDYSQPVITNRLYPNLGIFSFGRGLFRKPPINGALTSAKSLRMVKRHQFIYSRLFAFEGAYGIVTENFDGTFVSSEYPTFECDHQRIYPEFLAAYFKLPIAWKEVAVGSKGLGNRRQRVQPNQILSHQLWLPPMSLQNQLKEIYYHAGSIKPQQSEITSELDALISSILDRAFRGELT
jgi:type I restriction enzyme S subunit